MRGIFMNFNNKMADLTSNLKKVLAVSVTLNILLLSGSLLLHMLKPSAKDKENVDLENDNNLNKTVCFSCNYLGKDVRREDTLFTEITTTNCGNRVCCIEEESIQLLAKKMLQSPRDNKKDLELILKMKWWRDRENSAHLYLKEAQQTDGKLRWQTTDNNGVAFEKGVKVVDDTLQIPQTGLYFVYAAITLDFSREKVVPLVYHNVTTKHPKLPKSGSMLRLMSKYGGSEMSDKVYTSFLCGALYLYKGYQIETHVSDAIYIKDDTYSSYFGMFKL